MFSGYLNFTQVIDLNEPGYFEITIFTFIYCPKIKYNSITIGFPPKEIINFLIN